MLGQVKLVAPGANSRWTLEALANRRVDRPFDPAWSLDGYTAPCIDSSACANSEGLASVSGPGFSTTPRPGYSRYRAAVVHLTLGEAAAANALADTILAASPGHLLGYVLQGEAAEQENNAGTLHRSYAEFLAHYDAEVRRTRPEYRENQAVLEDFSTRARANRR